MSTENEGTAVPAAPSAPPPPPAPVEAQGPRAAGTPGVQKPVPGAPADSPQTEGVQQTEGAPQTGVTTPGAMPADAAPAGAAPAAGAPAAASGPAPAYESAQSASASAPGPAYESAQSAAAPAPAYEAHPPASYPAPHAPQPTAELPVTAAAASPGPPPAPPAGHPAPGAAWPPPPPPAHPSYGGGGDAHQGGGFGSGHGGGSGGYGSGHGGGGDPWGAPVTADSAEPRKRKGRGGLIAAVLVAALVAGGVGSGVGFWAANRSDNGPGGSTTITAAGNPQDFKRDPGSVAGVAGKALPSVVTIDAQSGSGEGGTGTGFVYDKQGHILTNNHVVASAAGGGELSVTFSNGKKYAAEVVGRAQGYDVAVLKLKNAGDLNPLPLGDSDKVVVGDPTIAIGAPFGLSNTVTTGIVSAKDRPVASGDGQGSKASYMSALQTDASINPGNSGGPLLDSRGAVIGINSAIQSVPSGGLGGGSGQSGSIGLGFAIPINQAKTVAQQLIKTGKPVYPMIGATVSMEQKSDGAKIAEKGMGNTPSVSPGGPAASAGLKAGDVITKLDDRVIDSGPTLISEIWTHKPGDKVKLTYTRDGKQSTAEVTLQAREGDD
ncbi:S1C family serine protease [Streptomyces sp. NPDC058657]|uniref:S1C family serine protease n=1 Tax=unclassified Streptomyces TaxID=2593676 RepID=UPI003657C918